MPPKIDTSLLINGKRGYVVAIDGPSGAGKSTVSRKLAEALGGRLLDTGAMYRAVAYFAITEGLTDEEGFCHIARKLEFTADEDNHTLLVGGKDLGHRLRTPEVSAAASSISRFKKLRKVLTSEQRRLAREWSRRFPVVVEGRDIGTVVFPKVPFKFFVTASPEVRARRRYEQLKKQGAKGISFKKVLRQHEERDTQDSTRKVAPLRCPENAVVVDTSSLAVGQVVKFMRDHIRGHLILPGG